MKAAKGAIGRSVDRPDPGIRFYLFHGPDEAGSAALGERLAAALKADKNSLSAGALRSDPALLASEAQAIDMFGGARLLWIQPAGDEIVAAVDALLEAPACESAAVAIAGRLGKASALLKLAEAHPLALAHVSYEPDARDAERLAADLARAEGLRPQPGVTARIAEACANDLRVMAQELTKLAVFLDASPETPKDLGHDALDAVGAAMSGDFLGLPDSALAGELATIAEELDWLAEGGRDAIPVIRALQRRLLMLAPVRARIESGMRPHEALASLGKSLFWKDKPLVERMVARWDSAGLARVAERVGALERRLMRSDSPPASEALGEELVAIARQAARRR